jgi:aminomethyltransferase
VRSGGRDVGTVTSGTYSPSLEVGIALALVEREFAERAELVIGVRDRDARTVRVKKTFV